MRLYFMRHGESEANVRREFSNRGLKHPLTEKGMGQASRTAGELSEVSFDRIYSSPVLRAIETTQILTAAWGVKDFVVHEDLREYDVGIFEGRTDDASWSALFELERRWGYPDHLDERIEGGESRAEIQTRFGNLVETVIRSHDASANVLLVGHGGLFKVGLPAVFSNVTYAFSSSRPIGNCQVIVGRVEDGNLLCERWGGELF